MAMWEPWHGCHRVSEGCKFCYIHKGDAKRGVDTGTLRKGERFCAPIERKKDGSYKIKSGQTIYVCFSSDFLHPQADPWREECWKMIKAREDCQFLFLTKRIQRMEEVLPQDWGRGYPNVTVGCTVENQRLADERLPVFLALPLQHRNIICQPMLEEMDIERYLSGVELVVAGGESDKEARPLDYQWILALREQCLRQRTAFEFRQCGTHFIKEGKAYTLPVRELCAQARKAGINTTGKE